MNKLKRLQAKGFVVGEVCKVVGVDFAMDRNGQQVAYAELDDGSVRFTKGEAMINLLEALNDTIVDGDDVPTFTVIERTSATGRTYKAYEFQK